MEGDESAVSENLRRLPTSREDVKNLHGVLEAAPSTEVTS